MNPNLPINLIYNYIEILNKHPHLYFNDKVKMVKSKISPLLYDKNNKPYLNPEINIESYLREEYISLHERYNYKSEKYVVESPKAYMENLYNEIISESRKCLYYLNYDYNYLQKLKCATINQFLLEAEDFIKNILLYCNKLEQCREIDNFNLNKFHDELMDRFQKERNVHIERLTKEFIIELENHEKFNRNRYLINFQNEEADLELPKVLLPLHKIWNSADKHKLIYFFNNEKENIKTKEDCRHYCFVLYKMKWLCVASMSYIDIAEIFCNLYFIKLNKSNDGKKFNVDNPDNFNERKCRKFRIPLNDSPIY
jgi:hypothetical protein